MKTKTKKKLNKKSILKSNKRSKVAAARIANAFGDVLNEIWIHADKDGLDRILDKL